MQPKKKASMADAEALEDVMACNCAALRKAARRVTLVYDRHLARSGVTIGQYAILAEVGRAPDPPTLTALAQALVMDRTGLSHTLKPLERDGLIRVERSRQDKRASVVRLTARGRERTAAARACWAEAQKSFSEAFGHDQAVALRALLRLVTNADLGELPSLTSRR